MIKATLSRQSPSVTYPPFFCRPAFVRFFQIMSSNQSDPSQTCSCILQTNCAACFLAALASTAFHELAHSTSSTSYFQHPADVSKPPATTVRACQTGD